jgi:pyridoxamine 5'-phosphate oxidase
MTEDLPSMRMTYDLDRLGDRDVHEDPIWQFSEWFEEACATDVIEANAMIVTTVGEDCHPSVRTVLMKRFDERGIVFYTNYNSQKGREIAANPHVALLFYWPSLQRQVRWSGVASRLPAEESDEYFHSRPRGSQIGSIASPQSEPIPDREWLAQRYSELETQFAGEVRIPRPEHWGGIRVRPETIEFWQGRANRLHDRIRYTRDSDGGWTHSRIAP